MAGFDSVFSLFPFGILLLTLMTPPGYNSQFVRFNGCQCGLTDEAGLWPKICFQLRLCQVQKPKTIHSSGGQINKKVINLPGGANQWPLIGESLFSSVLPSNSLVRGLEPLKDFLSWHGSLQGPLTCFMCCFWNFRGKNWRNNWRKPCISVVPKPSTPHW